MSPRSSADRVCQRQHERRARRVRCQRGHLVVREVDATLARPVQRKVAHPTGRIDREAAITDHDIENAGENPRAAKDDCARGAVSRDPTREQRPERSASRPAWLSSGPIGGLTSGGERNYAAEGSSVACAATDAVTSPRSACAAASWPSSSSQSARSSATRSMILCCSKVGGRGTRRR